MSADFINGSFEAFGAMFNSMNCVAIYRDKKVRGVSVWPSIFFTSWGLWNLWYYPSLNQWWSFCGGCAIVTVNAVWISLALYYSRGDK